MRSRGRFLSVSMHFFVPVCVLVHLLCRGWFPYLTASQLITASGTYEPVLAGLSLHEGHWTWHWSLCEVHGSWAKIQTQFVTRLALLNPLIPKSNQHGISPCNCQYYIIQSGHENNEDTITEDESKFSPLLLLKRMSTTNENINFDIRVWRVKEAVSRLSSSTPIPLPYSVRCFRNFLWMSDNWVSQALYQTLQTTKMNLWKPVRLTSFQTPQEAIQVSSSGTVSG